VLGENDLFSMIGRSVLVDILFDFLLGSIICHETCYEAGASFWELCHLFSLR